MRESFLHFGFRINAQGVRDTIDVIEIGDHLHRVQDVAVRKAVFAQGLDVLRANGRGSARDQFSKLAQRFLAWLEFGKEIVVLDVLSEFFVLCFLTEILPVGFDSIKTMIGPGNHGGQHFTLRARQA